MIVRGYCAIANNSVYVRIALIIACDAHTMTAGELCAACHFCVKLSTLLSIVVAE